MVQISWTLPRTWVSGEIVTAANMNTHVRDNLLAISGAWVAFTSTWSGTLGNGTKTSHYTRIGRTIHYRIMLTWGSTTSHAAATQTFSTPVLEASAGSVIGYPMGIMQCSDVSAGAVSFGMAFLSGGQQIAVRASAFGADVSNTNPFTWATGDFFSVAGTYEANTD